MLPKNALTRAKELEGVGQEEAALRTLLEIVSRKRQWSKDLEEVMLSVVEYCVTLKQTKTLKEVLNVYRIAAQQGNVSSMELVIKHLIAFTEGKLEELVAQIGISDFEDTGVDDIITPAQMVEFANSDKTSLDRPDRAILFPYFSFVWEVYRAVLDTVRLYQKMESIYHYTTLRVMKFCVKYNRATIFRRLGETLRSHMKILARFQDQSQNVDLSSPVSFEDHLEIRFAQLNIACDMHLYQESFRCIEDIHGLFATTRVPVKPAFMAHYYKRLTELMWIGNNYLFHACAWYKLYVLTVRQFKKLTGEKHQALANQLLCASLIIPDAKQSATFDMESEKDTITTLAALLGFPVIPKRHSLLREIMAKDVQNYAHPVLRSLYQALESGFDPIGLPASVKRALDYISASPELKKYKQALSDLVVLRVTSQLSRVYATMHIDVYTGLFSVLELDLPAIEKSLMSGTKMSMVHLRIDHRRQCLHFGSEVRFSPSLLSFFSSSSIEQVMFACILHLRA